MLERALEVVAQHYDLERDNRLNFEYHDSLQRTIFAALEEFGVSQQRKRQLCAKALRLHRGKLVKRC